MLCTITRLSYLRVGSLSEYTSTTMKCNMKPVDNGLGTMLGGFCVGLFLHTAFDDCLLVCKSYTVNALASSSLLVYTNDNHGGVLADVY